MSGEAPGTGRRRRRAGAAALALCVLGATGACRRPAPAAVRPVRIALYSSPSQTDPHAENEFINLTVLGHVYEPLVTLDPDLRVVPSLAERWDNPNELTWRFHLRQGVRFHDGHPLTAADVVASLERVRHNPQGAFAGYLVAVHDVRAVDAATVEITTDHPSAVLLHKLAFVMVVPAGAPERIQRPVGTGPYRLVRWESGRIRLAAFAGYWGGPPPLRDVELLGVPDDRQRADRLLAHEIDLAESLPPAQATRLRGAAGVRVAMRDGMSVEYLQPRVDRPPLADPRVRQAISLALDRQGLVDELLLGYGRPTIQVVPPLAVGYAPELQPPHRDVSQARRLLAEAGYAQGLDLELDYREGRRLEPLRRQLGEAGIRVRLVPLTWEDLNAGIAAGRVPFHYGALVAETADASDVLDTMVHSPDASRGWGSTNFSGYRNPELDHLIEASGVVAKPRERRDTLQRCLRIVSRDLPFIPLFVPHEIYGVSDDLVFTPRLDGTVLAQEIRRRAEAAPPP